MVNRINAKITADATGFNAGLGRAQRALDGASAKWERQFSGLNRGLATFTSFLAGGVALGALENLAKSALKAGGAIDDAAKTAGIGAAALQEYRFAAQQSGIEVEALDKALATFVRNLGEARRGNTALAETFARIGVTASDTNERALEKTFAFLGGIGDQAQRASLASELFGARAQRMATLVDGGAKALANMRREARALGIVIGDDLVVKADTAGDRIDALEEIMKARLNKAVLENIDGFVKWKELINATEIALTKFAAATGEASDRFKRFFDQFPQFKLSDDAEIVDILKRREKLANDLQKNQKQLAGALNFANGPLGKAPFIGDRNNQGLEFLKATVGRQIFELSSLDAALSAARARKTPTEAESPPPETDTGGGRGVNLKNPFPGLDAPTLKADALAKASEEAGKAIERIASQAQTPLEGLAEQLAEIQRLMPFAANAAELDLLTRAGVGIEKQMRAIEIQTKLWGVSLEDATRGLSDAFANAVVNGENLGRTLKNLIKQLAVRALSNFLFKQIGSAFGIPALPGLAAGGPVSAGRSYLVGEQGPEVFTPSVSGAIIPNDGLAGGGVSVVQNIRFDVGLESVDQRIGQLTPSISGAVVEAVQRAQARPRYA